MEKLCPKCGQPMEQIHPEIFDNWYVCRNKNCKGWFCQCCDEWHPYGTTCGVAIIHGIREQNRADKKNA